MRSCYERFVSKKVLCFAFWGLLFLSWGCKTQEPQEREEGMVAQVGNEILTSTDLLEATPPLSSREETLVYQKQYVKEWIYRTLFIEEFKRKHPDWKELLKAKLKACEEHILFTEAIAEMVNDHVKASSPSFQNLYSFYRQNESLFPASESYYQFLLGVYPSYTQALLLRHQFARDSLSRFLSKLQKNALFVSADTSWRTAKAVKQMLSELEMPIGLDQVPLRKPYLLWVKYKGKSYPAFFVLLNRVQKGEPIPFPLIQEEVKFFYLYTTKERYLDSLFNVLYQKAKNEKALQVSVRLD
jgi:hypothetical protein